MLKIIKAPDETPFTESDLKPGLKVIRKSDGAECVVVKYNESTWMVSHDSEAQRDENSGYINMFASTILAWLNRDFRRVEESPQYTTVGEVPDKTVFDYEYNRLMFPTPQTTDGYRTCVRLSDGYIIPVPSVARVTRVHGPLTIDPSVMEEV